ncbi:MAG: hypothetical protein IJE89_00235 [Bacilli bacterium]|nr:hypothetical protein [Bacilli bacterium]
MKIFIICSTSFYNKIEPIKEKLIKKGYTLIMPNSYDEEDSDVDFTKMTEKEYQNYFSKMYHLSREKISKVDAVLVLNYDKEKNGQVYKNYIGAATFLEMYEAFMQNKKIYILNDYPDNMLLDEIKGFAPIVLNGNLDKIN